MWECSCESPGAPHENIPAKARAGSAPSPERVHMRRTRWFAGDRGGMMLESGNGTPQAGAFFTQLRHHPAEATLLPGKMVQGPVASAALP